MTTIPATTLSQQLFERGTVRRNSGFNRELFFALKGAYLANLARVRQAGSKEERDRAIAEHVNSYIAEIGNDRELADAFLTWLKDHVGWVMVNEGIGRHTVLSQQYISDATPTGAALVPDGATFRVWAPRALSVYLNGVFGSRAYDQQTVDRLLSKNPRGYWTGFQEGAHRFWVVGVGSSGYKRDPYARELGPKEAFPNCFSILRRSDSYRWHDAAFRTSRFLRHGDLSGAYWDVRTINGRRGFQLSRRSGQDPPFGGPWHKCPAASADR
jgi:hypothetical protein